ncbi:RsmB/NOP family class I SAM-dependent RNA methyltransferase [Methanopyrus kandleri]|uniref:tRNA/rRNA cytosine-C5-methylase n=2 Tax=Methanopyrus kandleri TaxID=2320 RepID=Q8TGY3_METKA|nr:RsmB/NOP family class I SAM-dependent RNA methyltransferase [Methanopyrus kandleri]AAM02752.1 tRNA/rRNA cytosine-C5-methylase [Methanopyrus kandleri AV19]HII71012.1 Fmu (Sun) domain-containing protein [Methanopyrus kandleri]
MTSRDAKTYEEAVEIVLRTLVKAERIKPTQYARRLVMKEMNPSREARSVSAGLLYSVLQKRGLLDEVIEDVLEITDDVTELDTWVRNAARIAVNEVVFEDGDPDEVADVLHGLVRRLANPGAAAIVKAFTLDLKDYEPPEPEDELDRLKWEYYHPRWLIERWMEMFGDPDEVVALLEANNRRPPLTIRVNTLKVDPEELAERLQRKYRVTVEPGRFLDEILKIPEGLPIGEMPEWEEGLFVIQDEAAALASAVLNPKPGEVVVDLCAAPGGKTTHMAQLMGGEGKIVAIDVDEVRMERLREIAERMGVLDCIETHLMDGREAPEKLGREFADAVLVDPPCSADGTIPKNPERRWRITPDELERLPKFQYELLKAGAEMVKPGGRLLYSTCSMFPEEDEEVVRRFLDEHPEFELLEVKVGDQGFDMPEACRLFPHRHETCGFFIALMGRTG